MMQAASVDFLLLQLIDFVLKMKILSFAGDYVSKKIIRGLYTFNVCWKKKRTNEPEKN